MPCGLLLLGCCHLLLRAHKHKNSNTVLFINYIHGQCCRFFLFSVTWSQLNVNGWKIISRHCSFMMLWQEVFCSLLADLPSWLCWAGIWHQLLSCVIFLVILFPGYMCWCQKKDFSPAYPLYCGCKSLMGLCRSCGWNKGVWKKLKHKTK